MNSTSTEGVKIFPTDEECYQYAYERIAAIVREKPNAVIGLATGSTPVRIYERLVNAYKRGELDFSNITTVNLDEYVGLPPGHPQSYKEFMRVNLLNHINVDPNNTNIPLSDAPNPAAEAASYERRVEKLGPVDIWLLGVGVNGHVAFNEPGSSADSPTRVVSLTPSTIQVNSRFFGPGEHQPTTAISVGIGTLLRNAREMIVVATGAAKAQAVKTAVEEAPSTKCPLSLIKSRAEIIVDAEAASALRK
eukprot:gnl/Chilomastix_caulleri/8735.p1 GENE.gnl/Chilomastix_caulleri/8735~~gnl/Chilomastix_caulleri/8735.p1  ORF type:complete len:249 (-),score=113.06 gnl/Chilomastix_caulleri/8735:13-759(-)